MNKKSLVLCADDYGQNSAISQAIVTLIQNQRLTATSCMTNMPAWPASASSLLELKDQADIGLHFNLTDGEALSPQAQVYFGNLNQLIKLAFLGKIQQTIIEEELTYQLDAFTQATGFLPRFIDGHQHVHHLPIIRNALLAVYQHYYPKQEAYIRISSNPLLQALKQSLRCWKISVITLTGALQLKQLLQRCHIPHNTSFSGIYDLSATRDYRTEFKRFLAEVNDRGLIMCHPGSASETADPIYPTRLQELAYLNSPKFLEDTQAIHLTRF